MFELLPLDTCAEAQCRKQARSVCDSLLRPYAVADDAGGHYRQDAFEELGRRGLLAAFAPKRYGGHESPFSHHYTVIEEIARASLSMAVVVGVNNLVQCGLLAYGTDEQKAQYLPLLIQGEWLGAFSLSESQSGSDAASLRAVARRVDGGYRITGTKMWCSNAGHASLYLVMARTAEAGPKGITAFLVEKEAPGFRIGKQEKKLGLRGSALAELAFDDCFVPLKSRLGNEGAGFEVALSQLDAGRVTIGVAGLGVGLEALSQYWQKCAWGPRKGVAGTKELFAGFYAGLQALKLLIRHAAELRDSGQRLTVLASQIKLMGSDLGVQIASDVVCALGYEAYLKEYGVERLLRDAKALQIVEGTNQIQRLLLSRAMDKMYETMVTA